MFETLGLLLLLAVAVAVHRGQPEARHRRTDPACAKYRAPRTALGRWWHDRGRGKACLNCSAHRACSNCSGPVRKTVGMICLECGRDYGRAAARFHCWTCDDCLNPYHSGRQEVAGRG